MASSFLIHYANLTQFTSTYTLCRQPKLAVPSNMSKLLSLPAELLAPIVAELCPSQDDFVGFDHNYAPDRSLYRLTQTYKTLRDICSPKLYEICNLKMGRSGRYRGIKMLRTLATRPELAKQLQRVIVDGMFHMESHSDGGKITSAEEAAIYNRILEEKVDTATVKPLTKTESTDTLDRLASKEIGESLSCVALALVPNVTSIIFSSRYTSLGSFKAGLLMFLEAFSHQHADTELGCGFEAIEGVLVVAPNVQRFIGWSVNELPPNESYVSVKQIVLVHSRLDDEHAALLPGAFPYLESFSYEEGVLWSAIRCLHQEKSFPLHFCA